MLLFLGLLISFGGQLPIGYINLMALKIGVEKSINQAIYFALGVAIVELFYLEFILYGITILISNPIIFKVLQLTMVIAFSIAAVLIFFKWRKQKADINTTAIALPKNSFKYGVFLSATNLAQVPFWVLCTTYLVETKILQKTTLNYQLFIWGTGVGTFLGIAVYIFLGKKLIEKYQSITQYLDAIIALFLIIAAGFQLFNFF